VKEKLLSILEANVDVESMASDMLDEVVKPALDALVKKSSTKIDDIVLNMLYDELSDQIVMELAKLWSKVDGK